MGSYILVHGAGTGGWLWDRVSEELSRRGHQVQAPTLTGVGDRTSEGGPDTRLSTHIAEIRRLIQTLTVKPILVGFSYGGLVIGGAAQCVPHRIAFLAYLDAFVPENGRSMFDFLPPDLRTGLERAAVETGDGWRMPPIPLERLGDLGPLGAAVDPDSVHQALKRRGTHPIGTYREPAHASNIAAQQIPSSYIECSAHAPGDPMALAVERARAAGMPVVDFDAGHFPMLTKPIELVDTLEAIAPA